MLYTIKPKYKKNLINGITFLVVLICSISLSSSIWYESTIEYIKNHKRMLQGLKLEPESFEKNYNELIKSKAKLLKTLPPSKRELQFLLYSNDELKRQIALVNILLRKIYLEDLIKVIIETYSTRDDYLTKFYFYRTIDLMTPEQIKVFEDRLIKLITNETDERVMGIAIPILIKLTPRKVMPIFVEFFKTGSRGVRLFSFIYVRKMGDKYLKEVKKKLEEEKAMDALKFIMEAEAGKKPE